MPISGGRKIRCLLVLTILLTVAVPYPSRAEPFCSTRGSQGDARLSKCPGMLLCGLECANILCIEKRARCDVPAAEIVRGRARAEDVILRRIESDSLTGIPLQRQM